MVISRGSRNQVANLGFATPPGVGTLMEQGILIPKT